MNLSTDIPIGQPSFQLSEDQIATVIDLLCSGVSDAREFVTPSMLEVPLTILTRKSIRRIKKQRQLTNLEIQGEFELLDINNSDPQIMGRIDIILRFMHQFGDEEAYLGVECKRISYGDSSLNTRYVTEGVDRFASGKYALGHTWGMMLGYVIKEPLDPIITTIDNKIQKDYGDSAKLNLETNHKLSLSMQSNVLKQGDTEHEINLIHIFMEMSEASPIDIQKAVI